MHDAAAEPGAEADAIAPAAARCRNCGAEATGAFCPRCGQETTLALPSARQFLKDAAGRYVAVDGRLWRTLAALLFRPGFLTREYLAGRRRRYIRPARLFLVASLAMFAVLRFALDAPRLDEATLAEIEASPGRPPASAAAKAQPTPSATSAWSELSLRIDEDHNLVLDGPQGRLTGEVQRRLARFNAMSLQDKTEQVFAGILRYGPYAMFLLLPAFALLLQLVYLGRAARYPARPRRYAEHLLFTAHTHAFLALVAALAAAVAWAPFRAVVLAWAPVYVLWSMQAVYGGRWLGVFARAALAGIAYWLMFAFATVGLVLAAVVLR